MTARALTEIAAEIGYIVGDMREAGSTLLSSRLSMGKLLAEAKKQFKSKKDFFAWCHVNVIRSNGKPYSPTTIDNYVMFATVPGRYQRERQYHGQYQAKERATVQEHRWDSNADASRYQSLLAMWRACDEDDRVKFVVFLKTAHPNLFSMTINKEKK